MSYQEFQTMLRADAFAIALAVILMTVGVGGTLFFLIRVRKRDYTLLLAAVFSGLYGARLFLASSGAARLRPTSQALLAIPSGVLLHFVRELTFLLPAAGFLFCALVLNATPRRNRVIWVLLVPLPVLIGVVGMACDWFSPAKVPVMLSVLGLYSAGVIALVAALLVREFFRGDRKINLEMRVFTVGFAAMSVFVVHANLTFFGFPGPNLEPVGFFIFISVLIAVVVMRSVRNNEQLLAVRKDLEIAREIQASILPQTLPQIAGTEIAACYVPMKAVGGDFYEFLPIDDKRVGVLIADVSGHGVPAAIMASMVKMAVVAQMENASHPDRLLSELNQVLCRNLRGQYVTAAYLFIDTENKKLSYAAAGHPPALLWERASGATRFLLENGLMLGLFPDAEYQATELTWNQGDRFLLYTDGVTEAENSQEVPFGTDRLEQLMKTTDGAGPKTLSERLLNSVAAWRGCARDDPQDDITIIAVQFSAAGAAGLAV